MKSNILKQAWSGRYKRIMTLNFHYCSLDKEIKKAALTGVAQWIECQPTNQRDSSSIHSQGTHLDCRPGPQ